MLLSINMFLLSLSEGCFYRNLSLSEGCFCRILSLSEGFYRIRKREYYSSMAFRINILRESKFKHSLIGLRTGFLCTCVIFSIFAFENDSVFFIFVKKRFLLCLSHRNRQFHLQKIKQSKRSLACRVMSTPPARGCAAISDKAWEWTVYSVRGVWRCLM